jgi:hypothetical protein
MLAFTPFLEETRFMSHHAAMFARARVTFNGMTSLLNSFKI